MGVYKIMAYWINEVPAHLKIQEVCIESAVTNPWQLDYVPDHFKTQEMCNKAVYMDPCSWTISLIGLLRKGN